MSKFKVVNDAEGRFHGVAFHCPGCNEEHVLPVLWTPEGAVLSPHTIGVGRWRFNGDLVTPTIDPSVLVRSGHFAQHFNEGGSCWCEYNAVHADNPAPFVCYLCHSYVRDGLIEFLPDSTHALAGQTVALPEVEA